MGEFTQQVKQFWNELGINQRVSLGFAAFVVIIGMIGLLLWSGQTQYKMLWGDLDTKDMASVVENLQSMGIPYEIRNGNSVFVPEESIHKARMDLATKGIPSGGGIGFEIFDRTSFGISDFVQRTNYLRAVQGELQRTIAQIKGVREARVMIVQPQNKLLVTNEQQRPTASVFVDTGGLRLGSESVNSIRFLVANSVEALDTKDVSVTDNNGNVLSDDLMDDDIVGAASGRFKFRKSMEDYFTKKVEGLLTKVVGPQNIIARVSVELETEASTVMQEQFDPDGQVVRTQTSMDETSTSNESKPVNAAGVTANTPGEVDAGGPSGEESRTQDVRKNRTIDYEIGRTTTEVVRSPGSVKSITAAVFIAKRYTIGEEGAEPEAQPRTPEELTRIREMVLNTLGVASRNSDNSVTIEEVDFAPDNTTNADNFGVIEEKAIKISEFLRNYIALGFAIIMMFIFMRMLKRHKPEPISLEVINETEKANKKAEESPRLTPELLNELIREKPENVSTALKNWAMDAAPK